MTATAPAVAGLPQHVSTTGGQVVITVVDGDDAHTRCTCGHQCTNPAHTGQWAHRNHARRHRNNGR